MNIRQTKSQMNVRIVRIVSDNMSEYLPRWGLLEKKQLKTMGWMFHARVLPNDHSGQPFRPGTYCCRRGAHWHLPSALSSRTVDQRKRRCSKQLCSRALYHRQRNCRPGLGPYSKIGRQLYRTPWLVFLEFFCLFSFSITICENKWCCCFPFFLWQFVGALVPRIARILRLQCMRGWHWIRFGLFDVGTFIGDLDLLKVILYVFCFSHW